MAATAKHNRKHRAIRLAMGIALAWSFLSVALRTPDAAAADAPIPYEYRHSESFNHEVLPPKAAAEPVRQPLGLLPYFSATPAKRLIVASLAESANADAITPPSLTRPILRI